MPEGAYLVQVNGKSVTVQSMKLSGSTVTLLLPDGSLKAGDTVSVSWQGGTVAVTAQYALHLAGS